MQTIGWQPQRAPGGVPLHYERHRPEQTTLYRLVQQHAAARHGDANFLAAYRRVVASRLAGIECSVGARHAWRAAAFIGVQRRTLITGTAFGVSTGGFDDRTVTEKWPVNELSSPLARSADCALRRNAQRAATVQRGRMRDASCLGA